MNLIAQLTIGDLISTAALLFAGLGLFLNLWQSRKDSIQRRAEFVIQYFNQYLADPDAVEMFYKIEYDRLRYNPAKFHGSSAERNLDRLLAYFERISTLYLMKVISLDDLKLIKYELLRISRNKAVRSYLEVVDKWENIEGIRGGSYPSFRKVARLLEKKEQNQKEVSANDFNDWLRINQAK